MTPYDIYLLAVHCSFTCLLSLTESRAMSAAAFSYHISHLLVIYVRVTLYVTFMWCGSLGGLVCLASLPPLTNTIYNLHITRES